MPEQLFKNPIFSFLPIFAPVSVAAFMLSIILSNPKIPRAYMQRQQSPLFVPAFFSDFSPIFMYFFFPKVEKGNGFWTFLKMSRFQKGNKVLKNRYK
jgi:hypothetical protein